ncbi:MAG: diguanylate cyclase [Comamonas sp.]
MQLRQALRRTHTRIALTAVAVASVLLLAAGLTALRANTQDNLDLMARSLVYNVEAALVFGDKLDATESLARMVRDEGVAEATVWDARGKIFAQWVAPNRLPCNCGSQLARVLGLKEATQDVLANGVVIGRVELSSNGERMLAFLLWGGLALIVCMAASVVVGHIVSRRMHRSIVKPLQELGRVARAVHRERAMGQRVPRADIAELRELGEHFNALLDELEARQLHLQQENLALEHKAYHDGLTGVFNRVYFELRLMVALRQAVQTDGRLALLFLDLNHFKAVNDNHGHATGDQLLQAVAQRTLKQVRDADLVARLGGDEFVVLLLEPHAREAVQQVARKIQEAVQIPLLVEGGVVLQPSVSIGVALFPEDGQTMEALMAAADAAMYAAKQQSRTGVPLL